MTRITNFGRKRTYLEAGFASNNQDASEEIEPGSPVAKGQGNEHGSGSGPLKKKRKRTKPSMRDGNTGIKAAQSAKEREEKEAKKAKALEEGDLSGLSKSAKKKLREKKLKTGLKPIPDLPPSELRRIQRQQDKLNTTTCFICREKGHPARDCPKSGAQKGSDNLVGICYRCGSDKHTLSRCKKPSDPENPIPFASCFVCNTKGHLASSCPQNKEKGVYPNGGCCKLCGETTHLAKDCKLRRKGESTNLSQIGTGQAAGADEDDFHFIKRRNDALDRIEKKVEKNQRSFDVKAGTHSGRAKPLENVITTKKVIYFK